jgi:hypothetical protein
MDDQTKSRITALQCLVMALVEVAASDPDMREDLEAALYRHLGQQAPGGIANTVALEAHNIAQAMLRGARHP